MIDKDNVLQVVKMKGYVVPSDLTRQFHVDTFIMGAVLSDLVREKKLIISHVKVGRSPVYYPPEHKSKLQDLYNYLNEKDKQVYDLLKKEKVLRDTDQSPLIRVSLKTMRDYSKPIEVTVGDKTQIFYKWYLATDQEVHSALTNILASDIKSTQSENKSAILNPIIERKLVEEKVVIEKPIVKENPIKKEVVGGPVIKEKPAESKIIDKKEETQKHLEEADVPLNLQFDDQFAQEVVSYFTKKDIQIIHFKIIKKGEIDCVVKIPSPVGNITYFCKAKKKKKCNEGDIATAFVAAQMKKLPVLLLTPGIFPKKVMHKLPVEYPNTKVLQLEVEK
ncbi:hypothetical protein COV16_05780 [Candidatus Woesearchaeota archaeon CG10_big_fil_rev_8_21_14_0_10_34_8]|nr:MAG: hypothetical protein COV16_05780 [Candidatus Woesearchaeota archaeon CG10_big_fil_rev_8_21_14_0_10_34_8]